MFKLALEKSEEPEIKLPTSAGSPKRLESSRKTSISALLNMPKPFTVFSSVQSFSRVRLLRPRELQHAMSPCPSPTPRVYSNSCPSSHLMLCCLLFMPPSIFPQIRVFSNQSAPCITWPKYCSFSFSISPSNEHPGMISFRMDWLDLLVVQGTLKSLL